MSLATLAIPGLRVKPDAAIQLLSTLFKSLTLKPPRACCSPRLEIPPAWECLSKARKPPVGEPFREFSRRKENAMSWIPKQKVVVPTDLSDFSFQALDVALELVEDCSHVHIVHVLRELSPMDPGVVWGEIDDQSRREHAEETVRKHLHDPRCAQANVKILFGAPAVSIAQYAREIGADLIVVHSHGRTGAAHALIGSVTERLVRHARCPVLVIRE